MLLLLLLRRLHEVDLLNDFVRLPKSLENIMSLMLSVYICALKTKAFGWHRVCLGYGIFLAFHEQQPATVAALTNNTQSKKSRQYNISWDMRHYL